METINFKRFSNILFGVAFICAALMITEKTYGYRSLIHIIFYVSGASALLLSLLSSRQEAYKDDFNLLFWLGSLIVFIALLFKTYHLPYWLYVMIAGMGISGLSFFINPFSNKDSDQDDELLDR